MKLSELIQYEDNRSLLRDIKINKTNVVPFIGAGVSRGCGLYSWNELLELIASKYFTAKEIKSLRKLDPIEFADRIVEKVQNTPRIMRQIGQIFSEANIEYTAVPYILLEEFSPLLVTTNYDDIIETISRYCSRGEIKPLLPCLQGQVVDAIQLNEYKLLKIHGSIEEISSFVFSSEQYNISYEDNGLVKSYLTNIFNGKRVLFVGCSLINDKTLDVLSTCIQNNKNLVHYAILPKPKTKNEYLKRNTQLTNLGIFPIYYPDGDYDALEKLLNYLSDNNRFVYAMKAFIKEIIGDYTDENMDILYSILSKSFYYTGNKYNSILDIDYSCVNIIDYMRSKATVLRSNMDFNLKDICLYGFEAYLDLGGMGSKENIKQCFEHIFVKQLLEETDVVYYLKNNVFSSEKLIDIWDGKKLLQFTDQEINSLAEKLIQQLNYKGSMSFNLVSEYKLAERIIDYCSNRLEFGNRVLLLNSLGAFGIYFKRFEKAKEYLLECEKLVKLSGLDDYRKGFLSKVYNNLAIIESTFNPQIQNALYYNKCDIDLKKEVGINDLSLGRSLSLRATLLKELDPFQALQLYIEVSEIEERIYRKAGDENIKDLLISWMMTAFNIGLVAKDIGLFQEAYRIISKTNSIRLSIMDKTSKDYCSSVNVECELELLLGKEITNMELLEVIESRTDLPSGFLETKDHTWYVCALYFFNKKHYSETVNYINKALLLSKNSTTIHDIRQEVRAQLLLADARYELLRKKEGVFDSVEEQYCDALNKIRRYYGSDSFFLTDIYKHLKERFGEKYEKEYYRLRTLYGNKIAEAKSILNRYDFIL